MDYRWEVAVRHLGCSRLDPCSISSRARSTDRKRDSHILSSVQWSELTHAALTITCASPHQHCVRAEQSAPP